VRTLAEAIAAEAKTTGVEVDLLQFPEILTVRPAPSWRRRGSSLTLSLETPRRRSAAR
jgi:hypothetical protein